MLHSQNYFSKRMKDKWYNINNFNDFRTLEIDFVYLSFDKTYYAIYNVLRIYICNIRLRLIASNMKQKMSKITLFLSPLLSFFFSSLLFCTSSTICSLHSAKNRLFYNCLA